MTLHIVGRKGMTLHIETYGDLRAKATRARRMQLLKTPAGVPQEFEASQLTHYFNEADYEIGYARTFPDGTVQMHVHLLPRAWSDEVKEAYELITP